MKFMVKIFLVMTGVFFIGVAARAQGDIEQRSEQQKLIEKAVEQCSQIIGQFGSRGKAAKESISVAVKSCTDCATIMRELAEKKTPVGSPAPWCPIFRERIRARHQN